MMRDESMTFRSHILFHRHRGDDPCRLTHAVGAYPYPTDAGRANPDDVVWSCETHGAWWHVPPVQCSYGVGGDPVNGCDRYVAEGGVCPEHLIAWDATNRGGAWCECGEGCELVATDCCAREVPACETARSMDSNGDVDAVTCRAGAGCDVMAADRH